MLYTELALRAAFEMPPLKVGEKISFFQGDPNHRALRRRTRKHINPALMMILHNAFGEGKTETPAAELGGVTRIENGFPFALGDALATIFDVYEDFAVGFVNRDG